MTVIRTWAQNRIYTLWVYRLIYDPFEAWIGLASFVLGALTAVSSAIGEPPGVASVLPTPLRLVWGLMAILGGSALFLGVLQGKVRLRYTGLCLISPCLFTIAVVNAIVQPENTIYSIFITLSLTLACWSKLLELGRAIDRVLPPVAPESRS